MILAHGWLAYLTTDYQHSSRTIGWANSLLKKSRTTWNQKLYLISGHHAYEYPRLSYEPRRRQG